jgi:hypothetical protein
MGTPPPHGLIPRNLHFVEYQLLDCLLLIALALSLSL